MLHTKITLWKILLPLVLVLVATALMADSCSTQTTASQSNATTAAQKWGNSPNITNYYEYLQLKQIYEARDNPTLVMNAYLYSEITGKFTCLGRVKGFGIPYGTQWSQPNATAGSVPEPNALYPSTSTNADWVQIIDPATGKTSIMFVEPNLIITQLTYPCIALSA